MTTDHRRPEVERAGLSLGEIEVLIKEARRHQRRRYITVAIALAVIGAFASLVAVLEGGGGAVRTPPRASDSARAIATTAARLKCTGEAKSIASEVHAEPNLYGAYPTTDRLAANWPTKIYPRPATSELTTTTVGGAQPVSTNDSGWPSFLPPHQRAYICIFTGKFSMRVPGMADQSYIDHSTVILDTLMYQKFTKNWTGSLTQTNAIPRVPVPTS